MARNEKHAIVDSQENRLSHCFDTLGPLGYENAAASNERGGGRPMLFCAKIVSSFEGFISIEKIAESRSDHMVCEASHFGQEVGRLGKTENRSKRKPRGTALDGRSRWHDPAATR